MLFNLQRFMNQSNKIQQPTISFNFSGVPGKTMISPTNRTTVNFRNTFNQRIQSIPMHQTIVQPPTTVTANKEPTQIQYESKAPMILNSGSGMMKLQGGSEPATFKSYKKSEARTQKYQVEDIPDAKEEQFRSGCCGKSPVTYESEEKKGGFC